MICSTIPISGRAAPHEKNMLIGPRYFLVILALTAAAARPSYAQDKTKDPKIVIDLEKSAPANESKVKEPASAEASSHASVVPPSAERAAHSARPKTATAISTAP